MFDPKTCAENFVANDDVSRSNTTRQSVTKTSTAKASNDLADCEVKGYRGIPVGVFSLFSPLKKIGSKPVLLDTGDERECGFASVTGITSQVNQDLEVVSRREVLESTASLVPEEAVSDGSLMCKLLSSKSSQCFSNVLEVFLEEEEGVDDLPDHVPPDVIDLDNGPDLLDAEDFLKPALNAEDVLGKPPDQEDVAEEKSNLLPVPSDMDVPGDIALNLQAEQSGETVFVGVSFADSILCMVPDQAALGVPNAPDRRIFDGPDPSSAEDDLLPVPPDGGVPDAPAEVSCGSLLFLPGIESST